VLGKLARQQDANVLVGFDKADDAGVYQLTPESALVQTVDFFTPIVDDPYTFGQIAATNSLSDVYAMGGRPLSALAMVCFPEKEDLGVLEQILAGGLSKMVEAGCTVIGGHSIRDPEIKFGYAVTGTIHPQRIWKNTGAKVGDALILTKALGTGVISTAIKRGVAKPEWIAAASASMTTLNKASAEAMIAGDFRVHGCTDITGFGLIGHAREMALGSDVTIRLDHKRIPFIAGATECVQLGCIPGGLNANREFAECAVEFVAKVPSDVATLLFDPQTAGGLFLAVESQQAEAALAALRAAGAEHAVRVGEVIPRGEKPILIG
jgi:selenide,water dikinase